MKLLLLILLALVTVYAGEDQVLHPQNSDDILDHLEGNNYNIYILFFPSIGPYAEVDKEENKAIEDGLKAMLNDNPELFFATIDHTDPNFQKLLQVTGVHAAPSIFMITHGKGVWIYEGQPSLILERTKDFLPDFKEASSHQESPY